MKNGLVFCLLLLAVAGCGKKSAPSDESARSESGLAQPPGQPAPVEVPPPTAEGILTQALETVTAAAESAAAEIRDQAANLAAEAPQRAQTVITQLAVDLDQVSTGTQSQLQELERSFDQHLQALQANTNALTPAGTNTNQPSVGVTNAVPTNTVRSLETNATAVLTNAVQETQKALDRLLGPKRSGSQ